MAQQWFRRVNGQSVGPISAKALKELASQGVLQPDEQIYNEETKTWVSAGKIQGLVFRTTAERPVSAGNSGIGMGSESIELPPVADFPMGAESASTMNGNAPPMGDMESNWESPPVAIVSPSGSFPAAPPLHLNPSPQRLSTGLIVGAVLGMIALIGVASVGTYLMVRSPEAPVVDDRLKELDKELQAERGRLRKEIEGLKKEVQSLEDDRNGLQQDKKALEKSKDELDAEIKKLTAKREVLNRWKGVDLVLMNSRQQAVGLKKQGIDSHGASFAVFDIQEGEMAEAVLAVSRNLHIPRTSEDVPLAKDLYSFVKSGAVKLGDALTPALAERLRKVVWKTHSYVSVRPDTSTSEIDLAIFRDLVTNEVRMGFLHESSKEGIRVEALGAPRETIPWKQIQVGSARHGTPDTILPMLGNIDFLAYSLLRIAQKVGTGDTASLRPRVIVHCDVDISSEHIRHYQALDQQLANQGSTPLYYGSGSSDAAAFFQFLTEMNRSMIPARRAQLRQEMLRTDAYRRNRELAMYVEGEVEKQLSQGWGIPTVSDKDLAKFESGATAIGKAVRAAALHDATHLLMITIKEPQKDGDYHLSIKLFDETGKDTWVNEGERDLSPEPRLERFHVSSGELTILTRREKLGPISQASPKDALEKATLMMAAESPQVAPYVGSRSAGEKRSELVYIESSDDTKTRFRTLFDPQVKEIPAGAIEKMLPVTNPSKEVSQDLILRYLVARIAEQMLPPVGRVESVKGLTGEVVGLTKSQGITPGTRCRVIRDVEGSRSVLPTEAEVAEVGDTTGRVTFQLSGFEQVWPENVLLKAGDLLIPRKLTPQSVRVQPLHLVTPDGSVSGRLKLNTVAGNAKKYENYATAASRKLSLMLADALDNAGIPTSAPDFGKRDFATTHRAYGSITLSPVMGSTSYNPSSSPIFRVTLMFSSVASNIDPMQITFDVTKFLD